VSKNSVNWSPQFRSSEKCQFRSSEIRSSDRLPMFYTIFFPETIFYSLSCFACVTNPFINYPPHDTKQVFSLKDQPYLLVVVLFFLSYSFYFRIFLPFSSCFVFSFVFFLLWRIPFHKLFT
jgi:hypothetical protein